MKLIIEDGTFFDGLGSPGRRASVLVEDGIVTAISAEKLPRDRDTRVIDAAGCWVTPGFIDIHTHYDAEVEVAPALFESVRHGVTTVMLGSCSLSLVCGDPVELADMFCRVEAIPRTVVKPLLEKIKDWDGPREYLAHLDRLPLGPNVACLLGHSTIRAHAMGLDRALSKEVVPTKEELSEMDRLLSEALDAGYLGMSISTLPWDKMDGEAFRSRPMPSVFAHWKEYRHFASTLRARKRVLQAVPNISTKANVLLFYLISAGIFRPSLKTTLISMIDARADRAAFPIAGWLSRLFNRWLRADFRMQALPEVFDIWADGIDLVVFEEFEAGTAALHLQNEVERNSLLRDPEYRNRFKKQWRNKYLPKAFHRNFRFTEVLACPDDALVGRSFHDIAKERGADPIDVFLDLVIEHGTSLRWYSVLGNDRPEWLKWIVRHSDILIGFSDAGAHLRNMAHYNFPLRLLRMAKDDPSVMSIERAVERLTSEIARWFAIDAGILDVGKRADLVVIDPTGLNETLEQVHEEEMRDFGGLRRMVRRNDAAVRAVVINGRVAAENARRSPEFGKEPGFGRVLRAGEAMRYRNLEPQYEPHSFGTVLKWMSRRRPSVPKRAEMRTATPDLDLRPAITWIGHATWLIRMAGRSIVTDPVWSHSLGPGLTRNVPPPIDIATASPDVVLISHNHRDHLDAPTIDEIGPEPSYLVPEGLGSFFTKKRCRQVIEMPWWRTHELGDLRVTFVPSQHWSQRGPFDRNDTLWGGWVIEGDRKKVYFAGDTAYFNGFAEIGRRHPDIDAALLPIGAYEPEWFMRSQHMNPEDAVNAFKALQAKLLCAMHWGTFKLTDEALDEPPRLLEKHRLQAGLRPEQVWVAAIGETRAL